MKKTSFTQLLGDMLKAKEAAFWHPVGQLYPRLLDFDPLAAGLVGKSGLYVVWHLGVRPQWLRVGATRDLGASVNELKCATWVVRHQSNAGIFVAWAMPEFVQCAGFARFLAETLKPAYQDAPLALDVVDGIVAAVACPLPPGTRG